MHGPIPLTDPPSNRGDHRTISGSDVLKITDATRNRITVVYNPIQRSLAGCSVLFTRKVFLQLYVRYYVIPCSALYFTSALLQLLEDYR